MTDEPKTYDTDDMELVFDGDTFATGCPECGASEGVSIEELHGQEDVECGDCYSKFSVETVTPYPYISSMKLVEKGEEEEE